LAIHGSLGLGHAGPGMTRAVPFHVGRPVPCRNGNTVATDFPWAPGLTGNVHAIHQQESIDV
jgi:hypothetical protein